jgi:hypothetical protein
MRRTHTVTAWPRHGLLTCRFWGHHGTIRDQPPSTHGRAIHPRSCGTWGDRGRAVRAWELVWYHSPPSAVPAQPPPCARSQTRRPCGAGQSNALPSVCHGHGMTSPGAPCGSFRLARAARHPTLTHSVAMMAATHAPPAPFPSRARCAPCRVTHQNACSSESGKCLNRWKKATFQAALLKVHGVAGRQAGR